MIVRSLALIIVATLANSGLVSAQQTGSPAPQQDSGPPSQPIRLSEEVVVTASARPERLGDTAATVQVLDREEIQASAATTVTTFLAEHGVAFVGQWSPSQTGMNLRGGATDGQGRDFRSQVVILINGRRAGTANVSKLSLQDLERIEIVRGPGSLLYGTQAIGGVINLITRSGIQGDSQSAEFTAGSWGQVDGGGQITARRGKFDVAVSAHGGRRGDYKAGSGAVEPMTNTSYSQRGGLFAAGYTRSASERFALTVRSDGIYNAGFRGSQWDTDNFDNRDNQSVDATYTRSSTNGVSFNGQYYFFRDVDDLHWGTEVLRGGTGLPSPGFDTDDNRRVNAGNGFKTTTTFVPWRNGTLLGGLDGEWSTLRNTRARTPMPGGATTQIAPFDNNSNAWNTGIYAEHVQRLLAQRLTLRGGARYDRGNQAVKATPNQSLLEESDAPYDSVTYRAAATARVTPGWSVRGGVGTGYRAPTASELTANYVTVQGGQILGNPDLNPERTVSVDVGTLVERGPVSVDLDLYQNRIRDRIATVAITGSRTQFVNRGTSDITGLDVQARAEIGTLGLPLHFWVAGNGFYNFVMRDNDARARGLNTDRIDRMSQYQSALIVGTRHDRGAEVRLTGTLSGPIWYETEENLLIPEAEPSRTWVHRKDPFWLWSVSASHPLGRQVRVRAALNNLMNANVHPTFIAVNEAPLKSDARFSNGGHGNSLPGRGLVVSLEWRR